MFALEYKTIETSQGDLAYIDTGGEKFPVVLIHGNSCSSKVFQKQFDHFSKSYRMIAVDLPGNGQSPLPKDPETAYTIPGYAEILHEVTNKLGLTSFAVVGYSLGGNIALQWIAHYNDPIRGIMLVCSTPIKYSEEVKMAYPPYEGNYAASPDKLTEEQATVYMAACGFDVKDPSTRFMIDDVLNTDPGSRKLMVASVLAGKGIDETSLVAKLSIPLALVLGNSDKSISKPYIESLSFRPLWQSTIHYVEGAQHALPFHQAEALNILLTEFLGDLCN